jgi:hypothetical protein
MKSSGSGSANSRRSSMSLREIMDLKNKQKKADPTIKALDVAKMFYDENSHIIGTPSPQKFE